MGSGKRVLQKRICNLYISFSACPINVEQQRDLIAVFEDQGELPVGVEDVMQTDDVAVVQLLQQRGTISGASAININGSADNDHSKK